MLAGYLLRDLGPNDTLRRRRQQQQHQHHHHHHCHRHWRAQIKLLRMTLMLLASVRLYALRT